MVVSKQLSKQIVIEIIALLFLIGVIIYAFLAIDKSNQNNIHSQDGFVIVIDDEALKIKKSSDGEGLESDGVVYTITNNNADKRNYKIVVIPNNSDEELLKQIRVSISDLYVKEFNDLDMYNGGYVLASGSLEAGYTKIYSFKYWYKLDTPDDMVDSKIDFDYKLVIEQLLLLMLELSRLLGVVDDSLYILNNLQKYHL